MFSKENSEMSAPADYTSRTEEEIDTNYSSAPNFTLVFDDLEIPFVQQGPQHPAPLEPISLQDSQVQPGIPSGWLPAPSPAGGSRKVCETGNTSRERLHPHPRPLLTRASNYSNKNECWRR